MNLFRKDYAAAIKRAAIYSEEKYKLYKVTTYFGRISQNSAIFQKFSSETWKDINYLSFSLVIRTQSVIKDRLYIYFVRESFSHTTLQI